ncbi:MAG: hypothetical protein ABL995_19700 [Bryobacteraceae bacterium]
MYPITIAMVVGTKSLSDEARAICERLGCKIVLEESEPGDWIEFLEKLENVRPNAVLYDVSKLHDGLEEPIRKIRTLRAPPAVFAMDVAATPQRILAAIHAGASDFLFPPMEGPLQEALRKLGEAVRGEVDARGHGRVAGFVSAKGGCGATTIAAHTAMEMVPLADGKILLVDLDLESGLISTLMGVPAGYSMVDVVQNLDRLDANFWKGITAEGRPGVDVLGSAPVPNYQAAPSPEQMNDVVRFLRTQYGAIVLDLGRSITPMLMATIEHVDTLFLVTTLEVPALQKSSTIVSRLLNQGFSKDHLRVILNRMPRDPDATVNELERMVGAPVLLSVPNDYPALYECYSEGKFLPASHRLSRSYAEVAAHILGVAPRKKRFSLLA